MRLLLVEVSIQLARALCSHLLLDCHVVGHSDRLSTTAVFLATAALNRALRPNLKVIIISSKLTSVRSADQYWYLITKT